MLLSVTLHTVRSSIPPNSRTASRLWAGYAVRPVGRTGSSVQNGSLSGGDSLYALDLLADLGVLESRPVLDLRALQELGVELQRMRAERAAVLGPKETFSSRLPGLAADLDRAFDRVEERVLLLASSPGFAAELRRVFLAAVYGGTSGSYAVPADDPREELVLLPAASLRTLQGHLIFPRSLRSFDDVELVVLRRVLRAALQDKGLLAEPVTVEIAGEQDVLEAAVTLWSPEAQGSPMESFTVALEAARRLV